MSYREYLSSAALRPYVECYWYYKTEALAPEAIPVQRCLPLGTVEIIMQIDLTPCRILNESGAWEKSPNIYFTGLFTDTAFWQASPGTMMFGIRMKPESLIELLQVPAILLYNQVANAEDLLGTAAKAMRDEMTGRFDPWSLVQIAEKHLLGRLREIKQERNYVVEACRIIRNTKGGMSVEAVSDSLYISKRQLQRAFKDQFGTSPKTYQRIVRFRAAYEYVRHHENNPVRWADVSYENGYSDQAHFIRDFREFTGEAPSILAQNADRFFQTLESSRIPALS